MTHVLVRNFFLGIHRVCCPFFVNYIFSDFFAMPHCTLDRHKITPGLRGIIFLENRQ